MHNPVTINNIINHQSKDVALIQMVLKDPDHFSHQSIQQKDVIAFTKNPADWDTWKIVIPNTLVRDVMQWYHVKLGRPLNEKRAIPTFNNHAQNITRIKTQSSVVVFGSYLVKGSEKS